MERRRPNILIKYKRKIPVSIQEIRGSISSPTTPVPNSSKEEIIVDEAFDEEILVEGSFEECITSETFDEETIVHEPYDEEELVDEEQINQRPRRKKIKRVSRKEHVCPKCKRVFEFYSQFNGHKIHCGKVGIKYRYECGCGLNFKSALRYREHLSQTPGNCKKCPNCENSYQTMQALKKHYKLNPSHRPNPPPSKNSKKFYNNFVKNKYS